MYARIKRLFIIYVACHAPETPTRISGVWAQARLLPSFVLAGCRALPHAMRWVRQRDPAARARVKQLLDLSGAAPIALDAALFEKPAASKPPDHAAVTIVMPVYDNIDMAREALRRLVKHTDIPWRLVVIDDASPTPGTRAGLRDFANNHGDSVCLIELDHNLGFVGAVNAGLACALTWPDPVVLLNTDAYLPAGWATRLLRPIWDDATVASVTPMSNDAELGSFPVVGASRPLDAGLADRIDAFASTLADKGTLVVAPTGVGFCMAMSPQYLRKISQFDPVFSPGYGEEVDWCRKAINMGGRHVYTPNLLVAHIGGQSFGSDAKRRLIARNSKVISRRYPSFDAEVFGFIRRDPLVTARLALGLCWVAMEGKNRAVTIYISHSMGGGAQIDLARRIAAKVEATGSAVVVRFGGVFRFTIELWSRECATPVAAGSDDWDIIAKLLDPLDLRHVVYSNAVGDPDPIAVPAHILSLLRTDTDHLEVLLHDYFVISPSVTLLGQRDRYQNPPATDDPRHQARRRDGTKVTLADWQAAWGAMLARTNKIICFSQASADILRASYPLLDQFVVQPHALHTAVPVSTVCGGAPVIGVLGNIAPHKGAQIVQNLSRALWKTPEAGLVVIGDLDPSFQLAPRAIVHGPYNVAQLPQLIARYGISCWLIPSIWPETFSFTTHEAIATSLPVIAFDLGAQADAVQCSLEQGGTGAILQLDNGTANVHSIIKQACLFHNPAGATQ